MIILEAGEIWKVEPAVVEIVMRGVRNVLIELGMLSGRSEEPAYRAVVDRTTWLRSDAGGLLRFFVAPGDVVEQGQPIAQCTKAWWDTYWQGSVDLAKRRASWLQPA